MKLFSSGQHKVADKQTVSRRQSQFNLTSMGEAENGLRGQSSRALIQRFRLAYEAITELKYLSHNFLSQKVNKPFFLFIIWHACSKCWKDGVLKSKDKLCYPGAHATYCSTMELFPLLNPKQTMLSLYRIVKK